MPKRRSIGRGCSFPPMSSFFVRGRLSFLCNIHLRHRSSRSPAPPPHRYISASPTGCIPSSSQLLFSCRARFWWLQRDHRQRATQMSIQKRLPHVYQRMHTPRPPPLLVFVCILWYVVAVAPSPTLLRCGASVEARRQRVARVCVVLSFGVCVSWGLLSLW